MSNHTHHNENAFPVVAQRVHDEANTNDRAAEFQPDVTPVALCPEEVERRMAAMREPPQVESARAAPGGRIDVDEIKRRLSVYDVLRNLGKAAEGNVICCPLPGHDDTNASFSIIAEGHAFKCHGCDRKGDVLALHSHLSGGDGKATRKTFEECARLAGMSPASSASAINMKGKRSPMAHASPERANEALAWGMNKRARENGKAEGWAPVQSWAYCRADRAEVGRVVRFENGATDPSTGKPEKHIRPMAKVAEGWRSGDPEGGFPLYRLPELSAAPETAPVFVSEGEKASDALAGLGLLVTTAAHGAKSASKADWSPLAGHCVFLMPDNDEAGRDYADTIARAVLALDPPGTPFLLDLPDLPDKGDAVEFIEDHRSKKGMGDTDIRAEIERLAGELTPYAPPAEETGQSFVPPPWYNECLAEYGEPVKIEHTETGDRAFVNERATAGGFCLSRDIVRDSASRRFYEYENGTGLWRTRPQECVRETIADFLGGLLTRQHGQKNTAALQRALLMQVEGMATRLNPFGDQPENAVHLANGMLFVRVDRAELRPFAKEHNSRNRTEIEWTPGATCPRFLGELLEPALPPEDIELVQKYMAQCLLGRNPSQTFLVLRGTPGGGKGTLCRVIEAVVGRPNVGELRVQHLDRPFELARLVDKTVLVAHDVPGDFLNHRAAGAIKKLVGGDSQQGEVKGGNTPVEIEGQYNIIISTNTRLRVKLDSDAAAWDRRLLLVDYDRAKPKRAIPNLDKLLVEEEGPGILQWAVAGAQALLRDLDDGGRMKRTDAQSRRVSDLLTESDSVRAFVAECVEKAEPPHGHALDLRDYSATTEELGSAYAEFCEQKGWEPLPGAVFERAIPDAMRDTHRVSKRTDVKRDGRNKRGYYRVRLRWPIEGTAMSARAEL
jgi:putative DNA primase/helicase